MSDLLLMASSPLRYLQSIPGTVALYDPGRQIATGTTGQVLTDFSGRGNHGQLGSTAGVDTNDPAWGDNALVFGGDDYVVGPAINTSTSLTRLLVFKSSSVIDAIQVLLGGTSSEQIPGLYLSSLEQIRIGWSQPANATHAISTLSANTWYSVVSVLSQSAVFGVVNGVVSDVHVPTGTVGEQRLNFIGKSGYAVSPGYVANGVQIAFVGHINRAFGISEAVRVERCVRSLMASRGVTLA